MSRGTEKLRIPKLNADKQVVGYMTKEEIAGCSEEGHCACHRDRCCYCGQRKADRCSLAERAEERGLKTATTPKGEAKK